MPLKREPERAGKILVILPVTVTECYVALHKIDIDSCKPTKLTRNEGPTTDLGHLEDALPSMLGKSSSLGCWECAIHHSASDGRIELHGPLP